MHGILLRLIAPAINALRVMLMVKLGAIVLSAMAFIGIAFVSHEYVIDPVISQIEGLIQTGPGTGLAAQVIGWAGVLRLDTALSMILSAYAAAWAIRSGKVALGVTGAN